jgi:two-component system sensor histidine kinase MprB
VSLRVRLGLVAAAAVAAAVALASIVVDFVVQNELQGQDDRSHRDQARQVAQIGGALELGARIGERSYSMHVPLNPFSYPFQLVDNNGFVYRLVDPLGRPYALLPAGEQARLVAADRRDAYFSETHVKGQHVRVLTTRLPGSFYAAVVATPLTNVDHELSKIRLWLLLVAFGGIGIALLLGSLVARAALKPVRDLSETAEHVRATGDLSQRIEVHGQDELSRLAATFNGMLQSLDDAQQRQRQLVQDASHELRTPLTSLRTNIELLSFQGGELPADERRQLLDDVVAQLSEMTDLITELTELARGEHQQSELEEVRLDLLTEHAIRRAMRNHPDVRFEADLTPSTLVGMPASLERAIANLLDNAAKWSPAGSAVEVRLEGGELTVRDHGPGIAEADRPHVFDRFYRATSARSMPGSGLGLAIVRQVAEMHGGTVEVEDAPGGGTLMRLRLDSRVVAEPTAAVDPVEV